jgi:predicted nucleic acid-binding protein
MSAEFFLDTNVFVYSFDPASPRKAQIALDLIHRAVKTRRGIVSYQVIQEFCNLALRRFEPPMTHVEVERYVTTVFNPIFVVPSSSNLYVRALHIHGRHRLSWYDALIVTAAMEAGCGILYTEDLQHGQRFGSLQVQNPFL